MNWRAQTLLLLLNGLSAKRQVKFLQSALPTKEQIVAISPHLQILPGKYTTPTSLIHRTADDLIPWQHSEWIIDVLKERGIEANIKVLNGIEHFFDAFLKKDEKRSKEAMHGWHDKYFTDNVLYGTGGFHLFRMCPGRNFPCMINLVVLPIV